MMLIVLAVASGCGSDSDDDDSPQQPVPRAPSAVCNEPLIKEGSPGPAQVAAAGRGQMFEQIELPGITDVEVIDGNGGVSIVDINRDGLLDILLVNAIAPLPEALQLFINQGCWEFRKESVAITNAEELKIKNNAIPVFADFNQDGLLDFYLTSDPVANFLFLARDDYKTFEEVGQGMGVGNDTAYSRQSQIVDINGDGWLDIGVGSDQIGDMTIIKGVPLQRLYIYRPAEGSDSFEDGHFEDIGGTDLIPGFGGQPNSDPENDRASPTILLRDIDDDNDIDVVQSYHNDMLLAHWFHPDATGENRHGVYVWKNQLADSGEFRFEQELPGEGGLAEIGWSEYNISGLVYEPVQHAVGHPYLSAADVDNDGRLDLLTVGPTDLEWHVHTDQVGAKFWYNRGEEGFIAATEAAGLESLNYSYDQWSDYFGLVFDDTDNWQGSSCLLLSNQIPKCINRTKWDWAFYHADSVWTDFNNDGWIDLLAVDRHEVVEGFGVFRNVLYLNDGDGTFTPVHTETSGIDENSVAAEVGDLNGDGLPDLYFMTQIRNSYPFFSYLPTTPDAEYQDKIFWNTGAFGGKDNNWVDIRLVGDSHGRLIGSKLFMYKANGDLLGRRDLFPVTSYKSSHDLAVHFGLGKEDSPNLKIVSPDGTATQISGFPVNALIEIDVKTRQVRILRDAAKQLDSMEEAE